MYQALAEFWTSYDGPEYDLNVDVLLPGRSKPEMYNFNSESRYTTRTTKVRKGLPSETRVSPLLLMAVPSSTFTQVKNINQNVKVTATGKGEAVVKVSKKDKDAAFTKS